MGKVLKLFPGLSRPVLREKPLGYQLDGLREHLLLEAIPGFDVHADDEHFVYGKNNLRNGLKIHGTEALLGDPTFQNGPDHGHRVGIDIRVRVIGGKQGKDVRVADQQPPQGIVFGKIRHGFAAHDMELPLHIGFAFDGLPAILMMDSADLTK